MKNFEELLQRADWKKEKHVPVIEIIGEAKKDEKIKVEVSVGKEIPHPNTSARRRNVPLSDCKV
jgi:superoxide reductase